ncbi:alkaline phosphatase [Alkalicoccobacillus porphyridii]|uniref:Alkaline phosphatase n=1 Tax=Alkalicoccobacillus porphyridii TaxID=2597270 RepID=A0A553ZZY7_9BACI|nr:alkaline phosphatase [Alkalicoccobacillus porphyridii]TSB46995.1 alkaline phosphatase [Alkalicoccobacillus porphyridii]
MKKNLPVLVTTALVVGLTVSPFQKAVASDAGESTTPDHGSHAKNVIFLIPDGFSTGYADSYRHFKQEGLPVWEEKDMLRGMVATHSADSKITDSAAAGTALATGTKTNNGMLGISPEGEDLETIVDLAGQAGKKNGLVATSTINHATPAAFAASVEGRSDYEEIANQFINHESIDLLLGGGREQYLPPEEGGIREDGANLITEAEEQGFTYLETKRDLLHEEAKDDAKYLGLFADDELMPSFGINTIEPSLGQMTSFAIDHLSQADEGFFLMVEGSQIDWAGHDNDAAYAMKDTEAFEEAVALSMDFAEKDGETLIVMVGDHDTGGLSIQPDDDYNPANLHNVKATGEQMMQKVDHSFSNLEEVVTENTSMSFTEDELTTIKESDDPKLALNTIVSEKAGMAWTSTDHTAIDVPIYAYGPHAEAFNGNIDNTDVFKGIKEALIN